MDTFSGKADPYLVVTVDALSQRTATQPSTLKPIWNEKMQFACIANKSVLKVEMFDSEAMGQDRLMGSFIIPITSIGTLQSNAFKLQGILVDGRTAQGEVKMSYQFMRGARVQKVLEQRTEFEMFIENENYWEYIMFLTKSSRKIEKEFFALHLPAHEVAFTKAVGTLSLPLTGLSIKQFLTYLLVEHSYSIDLYSCREFCSFFKRKLDNDTAIMYRDIVKVVKERNSSSTNRSDFFIENCVNPHHWTMGTWHYLARLVSLYHILMVPIRTCFNTEQLLTSQLAMSTDFPADLFLAIHIFVSLNLAFQNSKSVWITNRFRIFKRIDFVMLFAACPFDWMVFLSGLEAQAAVWCRLAKMLLYFSRISPASILYSERGGSINDLLIMMGFLFHFAACLYFYIGWKVPQWNLGKLNQISWMYVPSDMDLDTYDRESHVSMRPGASGFERYVLCLYWSVFPSLFLPMQNSFLFPAIFDVYTIVVLCYFAHACPVPIRKCILKMSTCCRVISTTTCQGVTGYISPQNFMEIIFSIILLLINLTIYRWIQGEIANMLMSTDEVVIRTREEQDSILKFISTDAFTNDLCDRIQSHFSAVRGNVSSEQDQLLSSLSHGLRVQLARYIWRDFMSKVVLFRGCSGQFLDAVCVLVYEMHYGPEEIIGCVGDVSDHLVILVQGAVETFTKDSDKKRKVSRKGHSVSPLSFFFGVRQFLGTQAAGSGAICVKISKEGMNEVLQIYPRDQVLVRRNALNVYSKEKQNEGSVAFSIQSEDDDDDSENSEKSGRSGASKGTSKSSGSKNSKGSGKSRDSDEAKKFKKKVAVQAVAVVEEENLSISDVGGQRSVDTANTAPKEALISIEDMPLMKETEHIPFIQERLESDKVNHILTLAFHGEVRQIESFLNSGDVDFNCKDPSHRTVLHIAASEGHVQLVEYLLELKADPGQKDKLGNSAFNDAVRSKQDTVVTVIRKYDPNISFKLGANELGVLMCQAAYSNNLEDLKRLTTNGVGNICS